jgi:hypothetical protein
VSEAIQVPLTRTAPCRRRIPAGHPGRAFILSVQPWYKELAQAIRQVRQVVWFSERLIGGGIREELVSLVKTKRNKRMIPPSTN